LPHFGDVTMKNQSKRFKPSVWTERLVPVLLMALLLALLTVMVITGISLSGIWPGA
jgi:hypothetical protein